MSSVEKGSFSSWTPFLLICPSVSCREQRFGGVCPLLFPPVHSTSSKCRHCSGTPLCPPRLGFKYPPEATCSWSKGSSVSQRDYGCSNAAFPSYLCWVWLLEQKTPFSTKKKKKPSVFLAWGESPQWGSVSFRVCFVPPQSQRFLCAMNFTSFSLLKWDNSPYSALQCHVSVGAWLIAQLLQGQSQWALEERHGHVLFKQTVHTLGLNSPNNFDSKNGDKKSGKKTQSSVISQGNVLNFLFERHTFYWETEKHGKERRKWENINETVKRTRHFFFP